MRLYDITELVPLLRAQRRTIGLYCRTGVLAARKIGGPWLVHDDTVRTLMMGRDTSRSRSGGIQGRSGRPRRGAQADCRDCTRKFWRMRSRVWLPTQERDSPRRKRHLRHEEPSRRPALYPCEM